MIGWREWAALPRLDVPSIRVKIDTGARSSALHVLGLELDDGPAGQMVRFVVPPDHPGPGTGKQVEAAIQGMRLVRNPGGRREERPLIRTEVCLGDVCFEVEVTLTRRDEMGFPMLLGRQAVRRRFLVDPGRSYLLGLPRGGSPPGAGGQR